MLIDIATNAAIIFCFVTAAILTVWLIGLKIKDVSIIDLFWGAGFGLIAAILLALSPVKTPYLTLLAALPILWACRYTAYLVSRNVGHGEDKRYTAIRSQVSEKDWPIFVLKRVFVFQGLAMFFVAAPLWVGLSTGWNTKVSALAILGALVWLIGFLFEAIGDLQMVAYKKRKTEKGAKVAGEVMDKGLWKYTRHPNYFGNATMWWGIFIVACAAPWGWISFIGPLFMNYALVKLTGADHLERTLSQRPAYREYMKRTNKMIPWFPKKTS